MVELLAERNRLAGEVGERKLSLGRPIRDLEVEEGVYRRFRELGEENGIGETTSSEMARIAIGEAVEVQSRLYLPSESRRILVVGGAGKMGSWLSQYFHRRGHEVMVHDPGGRTGFPRATPGESGAEVVVVATPIGTVSETLEELGTLSKEALVFDIASIKNPLAFTLRRMVQEGRKVCSVHPMFGPDAPSLFDRNVLICDCGSRRAVEEAMELFEGAGGHLRVIGLEEHDRLMSLVLGLSHAVSLGFFSALARSDFSYRDLAGAASTTFRKQMDASRDVAFENPEMYFDIQSKNPFAEGALSLLSHSLEEIRRSAVKGDKDTFLDIMRRGKEYFGGSE